MARSKTEQVILGAIGAQGAFRARGQCPHGMRSANVELPSGVNESRLRRALCRLRDEGLIAFVMRSGGVLGVDAWIEVEATAP